MPDTYSRTVDVPIGDSTVTLDAWPSEAFTRLEVLKITSAGDGDLWLRLDNGGAAVPEGDAVDVLPTGFPWSSYNVNHMVHRESRRASTPNFVFQVNASAALKIQFKAAP